MFSILLLYFICASTFTLSKAVLSSTAPFFYVGIRMTIAGSILLGINAYKQRRIARPQLTMPEWGLFLQVILFHIYLTYMLDLWSMQYISSWEAAFLYNLSPFITAALAFLLFAERLSWNKIQAMFIGTAAMLPFFIRYQGSWSGILPIGTMLGAVAASAYGWLVLGQLIKHHYYSPLVINGVGMVGGGLLALVTSYGFEVWNPTPVIAWWPFIWQTALIILISNIIFYNFYGFLLKKYSATLLSFAGCTCPFFATLLGWLFLGEKLSWDILYTGGMSLAGVYLFYKEELRLSLIKG